MPDSVLEKIHTLNSLISQVEWSGILLYSVEGTIRNPKKMSITLQDIILMDKGTKAYTEYSFTEKKRDQSGYEDRHIDYCNEKEEACMWSIGHIHSHNTFNVFFSGTDLSELNDNAPSHNIYLSLIVNNALDFTAKIAFTGKAEAEVETTFNALDENGEEYVIAPVKLKTMKEKLFIYNCDIQSNKEQFKKKEETFFERNIREVLAIQPTPVTPVYNNYGNNTYKNTGEIKNPSNSNPVITKPGKPYIHPTVQASKNYVEEEFEEEEVLNFCPEVEDLVYTLFNNGIAPVNNENLDTLLKYLDENKNASNKILENLLPNLESGLETYFSLTKDSEDHITFILIIDEIVEYIELYQVAYPISTTPVVKAIRNFLDEYVLKTETT